MKGEDIAGRHNKKRVPVRTNHILSGGMPGKEC